MKLVENFTYFKNENNEKRFFNKMKNMLQFHFKLEWEDLPEVFRKIGIISDEYELSGFVFENDARIRFSVRTKSEVVEVIFIAGDMVNPYARVKVIRPNGEEESYYVTRVIEVQNEKDMIDELKKVSREDKRKGHKLYKKLME